MQVEKLPKSVDVQNGQYRAKHRSFGYEGVCNEQMAAPKGMVCSDLGRDVERAAEMTAPRNKRSNNVRQCPSGRAYFIRKDDIHMMVDPRFLFEWTGPLTYPDQMAFTRLCGVRFFLKTERRMFSAVIDGVTA